MNNADLRVRAVDYLKAKSKEIRYRPHELTYSAKQVADAVGGYAGALGHVADGVVDDLKAMGIHCAYFRNRTPRVFVLTVKDA